MSRRVLVPIASGTEDIELACITDVLRRANFDVVTASVESERGVVLARGLVVIADALIGDALGRGPYDAIALPGGMPGSERLRDCHLLISHLRAQRTEGRWIAAICAAPAVILGTHGLLDGVSRVTCHPTFAHALPIAALSEGRVVVDEAARYITSRGPGTAIEFALQIISSLGGDEKLVASPMQLPTGSSLPA
jgi:4-methyl-5(b-hydroxyethyl)-thiazole monophosphate biosynthesis